MQVSGITIDGESEISNQRYGQTLLTSDAHRICNILLFQGIKTQEADIIQVTVVVLI